MLLKIALMIMFTVTSIFGTAQLILAQETSPPISAQEVIVRVDGASCPFCGFGLEKRIGRLEGVQNVKMELKAGKAIVSLKEGASVSEAALRQAVKEAGFTAKEITFPPGTNPVPAQ